MGKKTASKRTQGWEWKVAAWAVHHPVVTAGAASLSYGMAELGPTSMGVGAAAGALGLVGWYRGHPGTFDRFAAPPLRSLRRRWMSRAYLGEYWKNHMAACDLHKVNRKTGLPTFPRILRIRAHSPSVETVYVKIVDGQRLQDWLDKAENLATALNAERVSIEKVRSQVVALVVQRGETFTEVIDSPEMPQTYDEVDLNAVYFGEDEFGGDWTERLIGQHILAGGASGSGKGSLIWTPLRSIAPLIRDGLVRLWMGDPKQMELSAGAAIAHRYANNADDCLTMVGEFLEDQRDQQARLAAAGLRKAPISEEFPLNILILDEIGELLAYGNPATVRAMKQNLSLITSQGRASGHNLWAQIQEPTKDVMTIRSLMTLGICLRTTEANHADMVLGENAQLRGALTAEIPNDESTAGIGFRVHQHRRIPVKVRAAYTNDAEIKELVNFVTSKPDDNGRHLRLVA